MKLNLCAVFITILSTATLADDGAVIPFEELDADHDNTLSADEVSGLLGISTQWAELDENADGQLSRAEYAAYTMPAPAAAAR